MHTEEALWLMPCQLGLRIWVFPMAQCRQKGDTIFFDPELQQDLYIFHLVTHPSWIPIICKSSHHSTHIYTLILSHHFHSHSLPTQRHHPLSFHHHPQPAAVEAAHP